MNPVKWMENLKDSNPGMLFRGQRKAYPSIYPSLYRKKEDKIDAVKLLTKHLCNYSTGITGYRITNKIYEIGILQHYFEVSQMIDLTGTPEVALYFSLLNSSKEEEQVIYAFEKSILIDQGLSVLELDLILSPIAENGLNCRWWKQDGYGVYLHDLSNFNLLEYHHHVFKFRKSAIEEDMVKQLGNLMLLEEDSLANKSFAFLHLMIEKYGLEEILSEELKNLPAKHPRIKLLEEIYSLRDKYKERKLDTTQFEKYINAANKNLWDTSWDAGIDYLKNEINPQANT